MLHKLVYEYEFNTGVGIYQVWDSATCFLFLSAFRICIQYLHPCTFDTGYIKTDEIML